MEKLKLKVSMFVHGPISFKKEQIIDYNETFRPGLHSQIKVCTALFSSLSKSIINFEINGYKEQE